jgi:hypothetical protein
MLIYYMFTFALYFIHLFNVSYHGDRSWPRACASLFKQRPITVMLESASRLLIILVIMTMQLGRINALNEMCAGIKVK